jgi:hypothetical protein
MLKLWCSGVGWGVAAEVHVKNTHGCGVSVLYPHTLPETLQLDISFSPDIRPVYAALFLFCDA